MRSKKVEWRNRAMPCGATASLQKMTTNRNQRAAVADALGPGGDGLQVAAGQVGGGSADDALVDQPPHPSVHCGPIRPSASARSRWDSLESSNSNWQMRRSVAPFRGPEHLASKVFLL
jgi:hypothetical protein